MEGEETRSFYPRLHKKQTCGMLMLIVIGTGNIKICSPEYFFFLQTTSQTDN
jgi:hypothetical protein